MSKINFHNKTFILIENSEKGEASGDTIFKYQQENDLVTADYSGGTIRYGKIIALLKGDQLDMIYQCLTTEDELKTGQALAKITITKTGKIKLTLDWRWLGLGNQTGVSEYIEI